MTINQTRHGMHAPSVVITTPEEAREEFGENPMVVISPEILGSAQFRDAISYAFQMSTNLGRTMSHPDLVLAVWDAENETIRGTREINRQVLEHVPTPSLAPSVPEEPNNDRDNIARQVERLEALRLRERIASSSIDRDVAQAPDVIHSVERDGHSALHRLAESVGMVLSEPPEEDSVQAPVTPLQPSLTEAEKKTKRMERLENRLAGIRLSTRNSLPQFICQTMFPDLIGIDLRLEDATATLNMSLDRVHPEDGALDVQSTVRQIKQTVGNESFIKAYRKDLASQICGVESNLSADQQKVLNHPFWVLSDIQEHHSNGEIRQVFLFRSKTPIMLQTDALEAKNHIFQYTSLGHCYLVMSHRNHQVRVSFLFEKEIGPYGCAAHRETFSNLEYTETYNRKEFFDALQGACDSNKTRTNFTNNFQKGNFHDPQVSLHPHTMSRASFCFGGHSVRVRTWSQYATELDYMERAIFSHHRAGQARDPRNLYSQRYGAHDFIMFGLYNRLTPAIQQELFDPHLDEPTLGDFAHTFVPSRSTRRDNERYQWDVSSKSKTIILRTPTHLERDRVFRITQRGNFKITIQENDPLYQYVNKYRHLSTAEDRCLPPNLTFLIRALAAHNYHPLEIPLRLGLPPDLDRLSREEIVSFADALHERINPAPHDLEAVMLEKRTTLLDGRKIKQLTFSSEQRTQQRITAQEKFRQFLNSSLITTFLSTDFNTILEKTKKDITESSIITDIKLRIVSATGFAPREAMARTGTWLTVSLRKASMNPSMSWKNLAVHIPSFVGTTFNRNAIIVTLKPTVGMDRAYNMQDYDVLMHPYLMPSNEGASLGRNQYALHMGKLESAFLNCLQQGEVAKAIELVHTRLSTYSADDALFDLDTFKAKRGIRHEQMVAKTTESNPIEQRADGITAPTNDSSRTRNSSTEVEAEESASSSLLTADIDTGGGTVQVATSNIPYITIPLANVNFNDESEDGDEGEELDSYNEDDDDTGFTDEDWDDEYNEDDDDDDEEDEDYDDDRW